EQLQQYITVPATGLFNCIERRGEGDSRGMSSEESQLLETEREGKWWVFLVYISTLAPWGIMQVHDAIDATRKPVRTVRDRLIVSTVLIFGSTFFAVWYVAWAAYVGELTESA
ncbi:unnamed protein product, partial [Ascophyllum nodosum]